MSIQELKGALTVAEKFWAEYDNKDKGTLLWHVFRSVTESIQLSSSFQAEQVDECYLTTREVCKKLEEIADKKPDTYSSSALGKDFKKLESRLQEVEPLLIKVARELGVDVIPVIHKISSPGGQGKQATYQIVPRKLSELELSDSATFNPIKADTDINPDAITYQIESLPKLPIWSRWLQNINMDKHQWLVLAFTLSPVILVVITSLILTMRSLGMDVPFVPNLLLGLCSAN